ncbi:MAG: sortase [Patescibacteria group bacterium]|nr:sortase [Patescibacteria group bacterium]
MPLTTSKIKGKNLKLKYNKTQKSIFKKLFIITGFIFLLTGFLIFFLTFYPVIKQEVKYQITIKKLSKDRIKEIKPVDQEFGIVIPKIQANAKVIANVDPFNEKIYQQALTKGVAHAKGTALPDVIGNTFIFSHSSVDWYTANRYNSVFYLLNKLEKDDEIYLYYQKQKYHYQVTEKKIVDASEMSYLKGDDNRVKTLTLMTCWPPGTNLKRLIVIARLINN